MAIDPSVKQMSPKQRERWAWGFVVMLGLLLLAWGAYQYWYRPLQVERKTRTGRTFPMAPIPGSQVGSLALLSRHRQ